MDLVDTLAAECELVSAVVLALPEGDFANPTHCTEWDVKELLAHLYRDVEQAATAPGAPPAAEPDVDAVRYWRAYDPVSDGRSIADRAKSRAAAHRTGAELARAWDWMWRHAAGDFRHADPDRLVQTWGPVMRLDEFLRTRVVELGVHGLDLADALDREPWLTDAASEMIVAILEGLLGAEPPAQLGWDVVTFIEKGTGRRPLDESERAMLGARVERFPLLG